VLERYPTREAYVARVRQAALDLRQQNLLLEGDVEEMVNKAASRDLWSSR